MITPALGLDFSHCAKVWVQSLAVSGALLTMASRHHDQREMLTYLLMVQTVCESRSRRHNRASSRLSVDQAGRTFGKLGQGIPSRPTTESVTELRPLVSTAVAFGVPVDLRSPCDHHRSLLSVAFSTLSPVHLLSGPDISSVGA